MKHYLLALALAAVIPSAAVADKQGMPAKAASKDIIDTALSDPQFSTLVEAIKTAGLVDTLKGKGPFTVFAPTNEAFAKIPPEQLKALLADKKKLTAVLTYHVVPGKVMAADVMKMKTVKTAEGSTAKVEAGKDGVRVDGAKVIAPDVQASNGVIHVIDTVMMP
ncbi:MAG: fasciclin domain-containing protein [Kofleriaceae bacterium]|nr:fasciclin domain-containing protein [Kofleriaceae bacterium]